VEQLNGFVDHVHRARYATVTCAEVDLGSGLMSFLCAGHPPPILMPAGERAHPLWEARCPPLGAPGTWVPEPARIALTPGSRLLLYTDGLVERRHRPFDTELDRLIGALERRRTLPLAELVPQVADEMLADERHRDDVCLLCLAFTGSIRLTGRRRAHDRRGVRRT
jgi:serine phosphatase RsbU (regulator of sigma subunit)